MQTVVDTGIRELAATIALCSLRVYAEEFSGGRKDRSRGHVSVALESTVLVLPEPARLPEGEACDGRRPSAPTVRERRVGGVEPVSDG